MDLAAYRTSHREQDRIGNLLTLVPGATTSLMDAGARDGYLSVLLANRGCSVTALDLEKPTVRHDNVTCVQGDITALRFDTGSFDLVLCAEVLEHLPPDTLVAACHELQRVAKNHVLIGVPFEQDTRLGCTTCYTCGATNPPWSHVNSFTEERLRALFQSLEVETVAFTGQHRDYTNALSATLLSWAGNPYGTYSQDEPCVHCGSALKPPPARSLLQKALTRTAVYMNRAQSALMPVKPLWIHILFRKSPSKALHRSEATAMGQHPLWPTRFDLRNPGVASTSSEDGAST